MMQTLLSKETTKIFQINFTKQNQRSMVLRNNNDKKKSYITDTDKERRVMDR